MNEFHKNLVKKLGDENLKKIQSVRIGLAGLGGLGSNCALNLARVGFKRFTLVDFDVIDHSNLDRQFYFSDQVGHDKTSALETNLRRINPDIDIRAVKTKIDKMNAEEIFKDCPIVAECFDRADSKSMLVGELLRLGKFIVSVSGVGGIGSSDDIKISRIKDNFVLIGDQKSDVSSKPALSPKVNIAAAKQADAILEYVLGR
ncbi:MAG: sulfur carrier protein ThiS adenylyltransferase ThiF [Candidatus Omnitrophica bacterium]|nr:sulfur carrier protein ThiS adenylyltransferase ThiF [Candidatus Omnitrophota bacterium]